MFLAEHGKLQVDALTNDIDALRQYFVAYRPNYWLFEGQTGGQYSPRSVQAVLRKQLIKVK